MLKHADILLCEDNSMDADLAIRALKGKYVSSSIFWVKDGEEALEYIFAEGRYTARSVMEQPKVIFLDLKMPKVNGLEVLKEIRTQPETSNIPVVIFTSLQEKQDIQKSYEFGVNSYIVKPVNFEDFITSAAEAGLYWLSLNQRNNA